ncbi:MAG: hypothetical protein ACLGHR_08235, partial [Gammaproteobacteria bacterium]
MNHKIMWHVSLTGAWTKPFEVPLGHGCPNASITQAIQMVRPEVKPGAHRPRPSAKRRTLTGQGPKHGSASMPNAPWNRADIIRHSGC